MILILLWCFYNSSHVYATLRTLQLQWNEWEKIMKFSKKNPRSTGEKIWDITFTLKGRSLNACFTLLAGNRKSRLRIAFRVKKPYANPNSRILTIARKLKSTLDSIMSAFVAFKRYYLNKFFSIILLKLFIMFCYIFTTLLMMLGS